MSSKTKIREYLRRRLFSNEAQNNDYISDAAKNAVSTLAQLLETSVSQGEGNSVIITGPRGAGKTLVVRHSLDRLDANPKLKNNYISVFLNGLVHTDDRYALLDIARQLNLDTQLGDKINLSFAAALNYMLDTLRSGDKGKKCIIFVLDEFDLFTSHKNQTLLYNLFDLSQSPVNPVTVIGVTCRLDVLELLEKRVKSRYSHRHIHLLPDSSFEGYVALFQLLLHVPQHVHPKHKTWNMHIKELLENEQVLALLRKMFSHSADVQCLKLFLSYPIAQLTDDSSVLSYQMLQDGLSHCGFTVDPILPMIHDLSVLELSLLIASKHVSDLHNGDSINFEMIFDEYSKFISRHSHTVEGLHKPVVLKAFEKLLSLEFLCPVSENVKNTTREYQSVRLTLYGDQIVQGVKTYRHCPTDLTYWVEKEPLT